MGDLVNGKRKANSYVAYLKKCKRIRAEDSSLEVILKKPLCNPSLSGRERGIGLPLKHMQLITQNPGMNCSLNSSEAEGNTGRGLGHWLTRESRVQEEDKEDTEKPKTLFRPGVLCAMEQVGITSLFLCEKPVGSSPEAEWWYIHLPALPRRIPVLWFINLLVVNSRAVPTHYPHPPD